MNEEQEVINPLYKFTMEQVRALARASAQVRALAPEQAQVRAYEQAEASAQAPEPQNIIIIIENDDICIICLENISDDDKIKPCIICETFMDRECLSRYVLYNRGDIKCPTCKGGLLNIDQIMEDNGLVVNSRLVSDSERSTQSCIQTLSCILTVFCLALLITAILLLLYPVVMIQYNITT